MNEKTIVTALLCLIGLAVVSPAQAQPSAKAPSARPAVAAPNGAEDAGSASQAFTTYPLITAQIAQRGGINGNISATRTVEGSLTRNSYRVAGEGAAQSIMAGYDQRLGTAGFDTLYRCTGEECGPMFVRASPGYRASSELFNQPLASQRYLAARRADASGDTYVALQVAQLPSTAVVQIETLRVKPREISAISVNAEQMGNELDTRGRVALYGIFFNTESAEIKSESDPTLVEIAKLMSDRPNLRLLVVGHTDSRGSFDYNIDLSSRRAESVVAALVKDHGIDRDRLKPWGVGYTAPRVSNDSDVGQAKNRRVELVVW